jgi:hypothetical protein
MKRPSHGTRRNREPGGSCQTDDSIGSSVKLTNNDTSTATLTVSPNWKKNLPTMPLMNAIGTKHRNDRERRRHHRESDLVGAFPRRSDVVLAHRQVAHDVFAHDDRVVDEEADAQRQGHQRQEVECEPERVQCNERGDHRDRQRKAGDDRAAPAVQEQEDDQHRQQPRPRRSSS